MDCSNICIWDKKSSRYFVAKEEGIAARIKVEALYFQPLMDKYME